MHVVLVRLPALGFGKAMLDCERILLREVEPTRAAASLVLAEVARDARADGGMPSQACAPLPPSARIRPPGGLDFPMAAAGCGGVPREGASFQRWLEAPAFPLVYPPVFAHEPVLGLLWMAGHGPTASLRIERIVSETKGLSAGAPVIVMAPSTDGGGECAHHGPLWHLGGVGDEVMPLRALSRQSRTPGRNESFEPQEASLAIFARWGVPHRVLANVQAKKVAPWLAVMGR